LNLDDYQLGEVLDSLTVDMGVQSGSGDVFIPRSSIVTGTLVATSVPEPGMVIGLSGITLLGILRRKTLTQK